jgi:hypothetical protein
MNYKPEEFRAISSKQNLKKNVGAKMTKIHRRRKHESGQN